MSQDPAWMESLGKPEPAMEVPREFVAAVRVRRRQRQAKVIGGLGGVGALVVFAVVMALVPWGGPKSAPNEVAVRDGQPKVAPPVAVEGGVPSIASFYRAGLDDHVAVAAASVGTPDRSLRIGDHWDPERVAAWVVE